VPRKEEKCTSEGRKIACNTVRTLREKNSLTRKEEGRINLFLTSSEGIVGQKAKGDSNVESWEGVLIDSREDRRQNHTSQSGSNETRRGSIRGGGEERNKRSLGSRTGNPLFEPLKRRCLPLPSGSYLCRRRKGRGGKCEKGSKRRDLKAREGSRFWRVKFCNARNFLCPGLTGGGEKKQ